MWTYTSLIHLFFREYIISQGWWSKEEDSVLRTKSSEDVIKALNLAESKKKASIESMFDDVYDERTPELNRQYKKRISIVVICI